jgi:putative transposase
MWVARSRIGLARWLNVVPPPSLSAVERGLDISYETGDRATATPVPPAAEQSLTPRRDGGTDRRQRMYLWRVVDHEGEVLDMLVQRRRDTRAC